MIANWVIEKDPVEELLPKLHEQPGRWVPLRVRVTRDGLPDSNYEARMFVRYVGAEVRDEA